jgi:uncharacterized membrane protein YgcG
MLRAPSLLVAAAGLCCLSGCSFFKSLVGRNTIDLEGAQVESMSVDIRKEHKTVCPRERVQMAVFLRARLEGEDPLVDYETWQGDESRNDKLDFEPFAFRSNLGSFDEEGWLSPKPDLLASIDREFVVWTVYRADPDKFTMEMSFKPDYRCMIEAGRVAEGGRRGDDGASGARGQNGQSGSSTAPGGDGASGSPGGNGSNGSAGSSGPRIDVHATLVTTKYYDKLVALKIGGDLSDVVLFPPEQAFAIFARGGDGGVGGSGGPGGAGGDGGSGNPGGGGGNGSLGGVGGIGGDGGPGGTIRLIVDQRFPEIERVLRLDTSGGAAGPGGPGGARGPAGSGGSALGQGAKSGARGSDGSAGVRGADGQAGDDGRVHVEHGDVDALFASIAGLTIFGSAGDGAKP